MVFAVNVINPGDGFGTLLAATAPVFWSFLMGTGTSVIVLRIRDPLRERPFAVPLYPAAAARLLRDLRLHALEQPHLRNLNLPLAPLDGRRPGRPGRRDLPPHAARADESFCRRTISLAPGYSEPRR